MSRNGKLPVIIPDGVEVKVEGQVVSAKGPLGVETVTIRPEITVKLEDKKIILTRNDESRITRSLHDLSRTLVANAVKGVKEGFSKKLEIVGVGYRAAKQGNNLVLTVGYSHPVEMAPTEGITIDVPTPNRITISGIDKEKVGAFAANVRAVRPPEPYKGKGIKYVGEVIKRKAGKAGVKAG